MGKNESLAELTGFMLGDGNITVGEGTRFITVSLNREEPDIQRRVEKLFSEIFEGKVGVQERPNYGCNVVKSYGWNSVSKAREYIMPAGDKKENQVSVPDWIFENEEYIKKCLKGLVDSDGSIYIQKQDGREYTMVNFKNHSEPLLKDFERMCNEIGVHTAESSNAKAIYTQSSVEKFIEEVEPIKAEGLQ